MNRSGGDPIRVVVAGGDGTAHELIEGIVSLPESSGSNRTWQLIILPLGTVSQGTSKDSLTVQANALHASLSSETSSDVPADVEAALPSDQESRETLSYLISSLSPSSRPSPLPITLTTINDSDGNPTPDSPIPSHIVLSTSLHAALLHTSEELRTEYPGLERFKVAAQRNLGVFFKAHVKFLAPPAGVVQQYNPKTKTFVAPYTAKDDMLDGPFTYLLSTTTCERLEPTFVINPTLKSLPTNASTPTMDIIILRPLRDPDVRSATTPDEQQERWKKRAMEVIGHAYKGGGHVDLLYPEEGGETKSEGDGDVVVETFRVGGFEWIPTVSFLHPSLPELTLKDSDHSPSHLVCADGSIHTIPVGGRARVEVARETSGNLFYAWA